MKSIAALLNLLQYFYHRIQSDKLAILSTAKHLKNSMKYVDFKRRAYTIYYKCSISIKYPKNVTKEINQSIVPILYLFLHYYCNFFLPHNKFVVSGLRFPVQ